MLDLPAISPERLALAQIGTQPQTPPDTEPKTVLYLAFGSNLNHKIITEQKGAYPLGKINVTAPALRLTFDLPGIPYIEPCFANTALRKLPKDPLPNPINPGPTPPPIQDPKQPVWNKGLVGTVYEITKEDYSKIMAKEGGGSGYIEILVPCIALPPSASIPESPNPPVPRPFIARTLYQPDVPGEVPELPTPPEVPDKPPKAPGKPTNEDERLAGDILVIQKKKDAENPTEPDPRCRWWLRLVLPHKRPNPDYAQASSRYLNLIVQGAKENELPAEYQAYLESLQPYTITTFRQRIGKLIMVLVTVFTVFPMMIFSVHVSDKNGKYPKWLTIMLHIAFNMIWIIYDHILNPLFGDGERTISTDHKAIKGTDKEIPRNSDEKTALLSDNEISEGEEEA
ncbi:hypothetical protein BROUX41_002888 [Berkeleyomyces rouxiae]|uniref:uncharacterized protein n=1 Tax=Berkeleyomyces rouxiae TaxID=2035830 RepID=UPI003B7846E2